MAEPGPQPQGVPAPNPPPLPADPPEPQAPQQPAQQVVHLNCFISSQNFPENLIRMQKPICFAQMTG